MVGLAYSIPHVPHRKAFSTNIISGEDFLHEQKMWLCVAFAKKFWLTSPVHNDYKKRTERNYYLSC
jgi:hypothetical protein